MPCPNHTEYNDRCLPCMLDAQRRGTSSTGHPDASSSIRFDDMTQEPPRNRPSNTRPYPVPDLPPDPDAN